MTIRKRLSRREVLRGAAGVSIGLPFLEAMLHSGKARAQSMPPKRFAVYYKPGGVLMPTWRSSGAGPDFTLGTTLASLEPLKSKLLVLHGLDLAITQIGFGNPHSKGMGGLLTGRELPEGPYETCSGTAGFPGGPSIDQVIANKIGAQTRFKSLEVAVHWPTDQRDGGSAAPTNCINYSGPNQPVPMSVDPWAVWNRLFRDASISEAELAREKARSRSILDTVASSYRSLANRIGVDDRRKVDEHLSQVRELERSLDAIGTAGENCTVPPAPTPLGDVASTQMGEPGANDQRNPQLDARMPELGKAMMDLLVMAFTCDLTRVGTMQWTDSQCYNTFPFLGIIDGHHDIQHSMSLNPGAQQRIDAWYVEQYAYFLTRLNEVTEAGQPLLDSMTVLFLSELQQADAHTQTNMPFLLGGKANGAVGTGRAIECGDRPHNDLLLSLLNAYGVETSTFGNPDYCTGPLSAMSGA
jgi:hypothetical protein